MTKPRTHWHDRWDEGRIGFHRSDVNQHLVDHIGELSPGRVLVPLCGKTVDMWFLRENGFEPVGVEIVETAVAQLFEEAGVTPKQDGGVWSGAGVTVEVGDIFEVPTAAEGYGAIWDRAAFVAIDPSERPRYRDRMLALLAPGAALLLVTLNYEAGVMDGPPFALADDEVRDLFAGRGELTRLHHGPAGLPPSAQGALATESVFCFRAPASDDAS